MTGRWLIVGLFVVVPTAAFAAVPNVHLGRETALVDAVPAGSVLSPEDPSVDIKVTNNTGKPAHLRAWLNGTPAQAEVPAHSAIVKLAFPAMTEGRATLKLTVIGEGAEDTEIHEVLLLSPRYGYGNTSQTPTPGVSVSGVTHSPSKAPSASPSQPGWSNGPSTRPSWSKSPSTRPSWSKSPSTNPSWSKSPSWSKTPTPYPSQPELPKTGEAVGSYVLLGGGLLVFGLFVLGLAWALGRRTISESARER